MIDEIEKCTNNLNEFLTENDIKNFCIEVHNMKGALANIGAMDLSAKARELEIASDQEDIAFCAVNLSDFSERLGDLKSKLKEAFAEIKQNRGSFEIPPELPLIFEKLKTAFEEMNFVAIDNEIANLDSLNLSSALKEETEQIKDAVLIMDYEKAIIVMQKLLNTG
jgi:HPt (histidine-containing phosphotransfer) domain-containing protein